jgi:hypothetical protein
VSRALIATGVVLCAFAVAAAGCGGGEPDLEDPDPPVGSPVLPDLVPAPPQKLHLRRMNSRWSLAFDSILVNIGDGEFRLRAKRDDADRWHVEQDVGYSTSGAEVVPSRATLVWGGDGHDHWHVKRVATTRLERLDADGHPIPGESWNDAKIGFCFYDDSRALAKKGPNEPVHSHRSCGKEDDDVVAMGLSPGWADTYPWVLPGQSIDITDLPDGRYRLWAEADERRWFREATRDNNVTWSDFELSTRPDGIRVAHVTGTGPGPRIL